MALSAEQRLQKTLELEQIVNVQAAEKISAESRSEVAAAVAEQATRGTLNSGGTYKVLATINARKTEKIIRQRIESRRASILKAPGLAAPQRFSELIAELEHTVDLIMGSVRNQFSHIAPQIADHFAKLSLPDEGAPLKALARNEVNIMRREWELAEQPEPFRTIFVSCGQYRMEEKKLGAEIVAEIDRVPSFRGYFAENQSSLAGLSAHIFKALDHCARFIAVMHHRGSFQNDRGETITRGSLWIEQELAIVAFLCANRGNEIPVSVYIQRGITLEGVRSQLIVNPFEFDSDAEVLADVRPKIQSWTVAI